MDLSLVTLFISIRILDVIDILLVAFLLYQIYMLIRGTVAINIFLGIFTLYIFWLVVKALNMELLSSILGQIIGVGVIPFAFGHTILFEKPFFNRKIADA
jgi:DNA integrity scanning protein DisA with diadenylate cyclase activity